MNVFFFQFIKVINIFVFNCICKKFKFVICRKNLSSKLKICEWHNYGDDLRFEYEEALVQIPKETEEIKNIPYDDEKLLKISQIDEKTPQSNKSGFLSQAMSYGKSFFFKKRKTH